MSSPGRRAFASSESPPRADAAPPSPGRTPFRLALRIYLVTLLPFIATSLVIGALDLALDGPAPAPRPLLLPLGLLLFFGAVAAALFARSLARPITRLAQTAADLGAGNLEARTGIDRRDELGDLARALDEMAERVAFLMRAQKKLLANVSHELRTPLARMRVALDLVDPAAVPGCEQELRGIAEDLKELEQLVGNILMTARLDLQAGETAALPLHLEDLEARPIVDAAVARFRQKSPSRRIELALDEALPAIRADRVLIRRVIDNLLDNARKYSEAESAVTLRAACDQGGLRVEVEDQGIGISQADLDRIFTPFFRTDRSRSRATGGVGLGLSLSRQIVEAHGGTISIESEEGKGTRVWFSLPGRAVDNKPVN